MKKIIPLLLLAILIQFSNASGTTQHFSTSVPEHKKLFNNSVINNNRGTGTSLSPVYIAVYHSGGTANYYFPFFLTIPYGQSYAFTFPDYTGVSVMRLYASTNFSSSEFVTLTGVNGSVLYGQGQWGSNWVDLYNGNGPQDFIGGITIDVD